LIGSLQPTATERRLMRVVNSLNAGWLLNVLNAVKPMADKSFDYIPFTALFNVTGQPAMSVPLYWNADGLPIGVQCVARLGQDATLFRLAGQLERAQPWFDRVAPGYAA
jgi:amidase